MRPDFQLHGWYFIVSSFFEVHAAKDVYDTKTPAKHRGCWLVSTAFKVRRYSSKPWMKERLLNTLAVGTETSRNPYLCLRLKESWIQAVDNNLLDSAFSHNTLLHKLKIQFFQQLTVLSAAPTCRSICAMVIVRSSILCGCWTWANAPSNFGIFCQSTKAILEVALSYIRHYKSIYYNICNILYSKR